MSGNDLHGGPAFPRTGVGNAGTSYDVHAQDGMTLRDYLAAAAVQSESCREICQSNYGAVTPNLLAFTAYGIAIAMLEARNVK